MPMPKFDPKRPVSWSCLSSWEWNKNEWYEKYVLNVVQAPTPAMIFGNVVGESFCTDEPMVPDIVTYSHMEYELRPKLGDINLVGFVDSYCPKDKLLREYKTSKNANRWSQKSVDEHGQLTMYALLLYLQDKVKPEELTIHLDHIPTVEGGDFQIEIADPVTINTFETKRTLTDILKFGDYITKTHKEMLEYTPNA